MVSSLCHPLELFKTEQTAEIRRQENRKNDRKVWPTETGICQQEGPILLHHNTQPSKNLINRIPKFCLIQHTVQISRPRITSFQTPGQLFHQQNLYKADASIRRYYRIPSNKRKRRKNNNTIKNESLYPLKPAKRYFQSIFMFTYFFFLIPADSKTLL